MDHEREVKNKHAVHFSSKRPDWATPWPFFEKLNEEFGFTLDVCAEAHNAKCPDYITPEINGLTTEWLGRCYMNPPYGRDIGKWVSRARMQSSWNGALVVCLLPARTDTKWFHEDIAGVADEVRFVRGRIRFEGSEAGAPFPSMVVVYQYRDLSDEPHGNTRFTTMSAK